jgi:hypothetical protein
MQARIVMRGVLYRCSSPKRLSHNKWLADLAEFPAGDGYTPPLPLSARRHARVHRSAVGVFYAYLLTYFITGEPDDISF